MKKDSHCGPLVTKMPTFPKVEGIMLWLKMNSLRTKHVFLQHLFLLKKEKIFLFKTKFFCCQCNHGLWAKGHCFIYVLVTNIIKKTMDSFHITQNQKFFNIWPCMLKMFCFVYCCSPCSHKTHEKPLASASQVMGSGHMPPYPTKPMVKCHHIMCKSKFQKQNTKSFLPVCWCKPSAWSYVLSV